MISNLSNQVSNQTFRFTKCQWRSGLGGVCGSVCLTVKPGNRDAFKENQEEKAHPTGWVVVEEFEHVQPALEEEPRKEKTGEWVEAGRSRSSRITSGQRITLAVVGVTSLLRGFTRAGFIRMDQTRPAKAQHRLLHVFTISRVYRVSRGTDSKRPSIVHRGSSSLMLFTLPVATIRVCAWVMKSSLAAEGRGGVIACLNQTWPCPGVIQSTLDHFFAWCWCGSQKYVMWK